GDDEVFEAFGLRHQAGGVVGGAGAEDGIGGAVEVLVGLQKRAAVVVVDGAGDEPAGVALLGFGLGSRLDELAAVVVDVFGDEAVTVGGGDDLADFVVTGDGAPGGGGHVGLRRAGDAAAVVVSCGRRDGGGMAERPDSVAARLAIAVGVVGETGG